VGEYIKMSEQGGIAEGRDARCGQVGRLEKEIHPEMAMHDETQG
jgi:hypothetical protein